MRQFILEGPRQLTEAAAEVSRLRPDTRPADRVLLLGMGGSALSGGLVDLLRHSQKSGWDWRVVREYDLPVAAEPGTLAFALSYSGNTEETLEAFSEAAASGARLLAVSAGGKLEQAATARRVPWIRIPPKPDGFQPRFALYFMFGVLYETLVRAGLLQAVEPLQSLADWLLSLDLEDEGRDVAAWLGSRIPVVYSTPAYESGVARTWRIKFNENSKVPALAGALPEANHNEMIAFTPQLADQYAFLLLPSPDAHPRILRRFHLFAETLEHTGYPVRSLPMKGENPLRRALSSLLLADWTSYYLARDHGLDPIGIPAIQDFKAKL